MLLDQFLPHYCIYSLTFKSSALSGFVELFGDAAIQGILEVTVKTNNIQ